MPTLQCDTDRALRGAPVAVIDFETTGLEPGDRHPVQIALCRCLLGDRVVDRWTSLVRPPTPIPASASAIHGISDADVADAPTIDDLLDELMERLDGQILCAYNLPFDHGVLSDVLADRDRQPLPLCGLDPLVWVKCVDKYQRGKRLEDAALRRGIKFKAHDAMADVDATVGVMPGLLRSLALDGFLTPVVLHHVDRFWAWQRSTALAQEQDYRAYRLAKGLTEPTMSWHQGLGEGV
ncbi:MAG: 3'-5' exonuclease [Oligoflexia bacterium]|nr:3'-5' exonuclease [Oligoflexia bacterium]